MRSVTAATAVARTKESTALLAIATLGSLTMVTAAMPVKCKPQIAIVASIQQTWMRHWPLSEKAASEAAAAKSVPIAMEAAMNSRSQMMYPCTLTADMPT